MSGRRRKELFQRDDTRLRRTPQRLGQRWNRRSIAPGDCGFQPHGGIADGMGTDIAGSPFDAMGLDLDRRQIAAFLKRGDSGDPVPHFPDKDPHDAMVDGVIGTAPLRLDRADVETAGHRIQAPFDALPQ